MPLPAKIELFSPDLGRLAGWAKALSHPARLQILQVLAQRGTCICGDIVDELPLAQASVSRHLKVLKEVGLIRGEIDGPRICYCLDPDAIDALRQQMTDFLADLPDLSATTTCC